MQIRKVRIEWMKGWASSPYCEVLVDCVPPFTLMRYKQKDSLWFAEKDGYVSFFSWKGPGNNGGYGGREFAVVREDGEAVILRGPWSSRSGVMNRHFQHCVEVSITDDPNVFERGHTFSSGALLVPKLAAAMPEGTHLVAEDRHGEVVYVPCLISKTVEESKELAPGGRNERVHQVAAVLEGM